MASAESSHWWYRCLHERVLDELRSRWGADTSIRILDAGCGTGGLMRRLRKSGYRNLLGIDLSPIAIGTCRARGLDCRRGSIQDKGFLGGAGDFDVCVASDVLYFLQTHGERAGFLDLMWERLNPGGLLIIHLPARNELRGIHDLSVGIEERFDKTGIERLLGASRFAVRRVDYRMFLLSPLVFAGRLAQRIRLRLQGKNTPIRSDVQVPGPCLNQALYRLLRFEDRRLSFKPYGSSLLAVLEKT